MPTRSLAALAVQVVLLALAAYVAFATDAFPGATLGARAAIVVLLVVVSYLVAWVSRLHQHLGLLLHAVRQQVTAAAPRDDRQAVEILIGGVAPEEGAVREKAHRNLVRLTGQDLPPDETVWRSWWEGAREGFTARRGAGPSPGSGASSGT